jgi:signal transduction histidine kinase
MPYSDNKTPAIRAKTDASLRAERVQTDKELARRRSEVEEDTDAVLHIARERADSVLSGARRKEDEKPLGKATIQVREERLREDAAIAKDREDADATLAAERVHRQVALANLLIAERQETDSRLLIERIRADEILSHRDDFLAMLSHDLRSLLGNVALAAALLEGQRQYDPARAARYTASIQRATAQMTRLVADLLDVASFDANKVVLVRGDQRQLFLWVGDNYFCGSIRRADGVMGRPNVGTLMGSIETKMSRWSPTRRSAC